MKSVKSWKCVVVLAALPIIVMGWVLSVPAFAAQDDFPNKEITMICSMAAGGGRDLLSRGVARVMSKYLKVPVVVTNVAGAGGVLGATRLYNSAPDGYTIGPASMTEVFNQLMEKTDYDVRKCIHLGRVQSTPGFMYARADSPFRSIKDLTKYGKPIRYSAFSYGSHDTIVTMIIADREKWDLRLIGGYKGAADATLGLVRGDVDLSGSAIVNAREHIRAGTLRPIMVIDEVRSPNYPETETVVEWGYPELVNFKADTWFLAPPGVPKERVKILEDALRNAVNDPEFLEWAKGAGLDLAWQGGEAYTKVVNALFDIFGQYQPIVQKYMKN
ncbi:MAG: tripartite tricarboxylate transporter substrate binding protein [Syntrophaceae bacterium]|nr:tripartite tricarboxylate transporter substrate binding protein [Syntrophaceae bacterium]